MAENGRPAAESESEPSPPGGVGDVVISEFPVEGAIFPLSKSSVDVVARPLLQEDLRKSSSSPTCSRTESHKSAGTPPVTDDYQGGGCGGEPSPPAGTAECQRSSPPHGGPEMPATGERRDERMTTGELEEPRSERSQDGTPRRDGSPGMPETLPPPCHRVAHPCSVAETATAAATCCPTLVCKQPMQLLQSNTMTTCSSAGSSSPAQQPPGGGVWICGPSPPHGEGGGDEPCFLGGHHGGPPEDTFAAYCHPLPIPAPAQVLPRLPPGSEGERPPPPLPPHAALLAFPRLISSVSETGLDAKRMLGCCGGGGGGPDLREQGGARPGEARVAAVTVTRETGTMTSRGELRDAAVQTGLAEPPPPPHVFPKVSLAADEADGRGKRGGEGPNGAVGGGGGGGQKSPIKEVLWDAEGMTWEVYGASVDPEELGLAIQKHLELQIKENASQMAKLTRQDTVSSRQSQSQRPPRKRGFTMGPLRNPACCARSSGVLD